LGQKKYPDFKKTGYYVDFIQLAKSLNWEK